MQRTDHAQPQPGPRSTEAAAQGQHAQQDADTGKNGEALSDEAAGKEILFRKIKRMKEKMQDPVNYYTFDLFEEYLFQLLIEAMQSEHFCQMDLMGTDAASFSSGGMDAGDAFRIDETIRWLAITPQEKEVAEGTISVRDRATDQTAISTVAEFTEKLRREVAEHK